MYMTFRWSGVLVVGVLVVGVLVVGVLVVGVLVVGGLIGCGGGDRATTPVADMAMPEVTTTASAGQVESAAPVASSVSEPMPEASLPLARTTIALPVNENSPPEVVVLAFLKAMREGNSALADALLSDQARAETQKHEWPVQTPGAPSAKYQTGRVVFKDDQKSIAHVECMWTESSEQDGQVSFEIVWSMRRQPDGWRVAGFATEVVPGKPPYYFNFEDIADLKATQATAENAMAESLTAETPPAGVAERPDTTNRAVK